VHLANVGAATALIDLQRGGGGGGGGGGRRQDPSSSTVRPHNSSRWRGGGGGALDAHHGANASVHGSLAMAAEAVAVWAKLEEVARLCAWASRRAGPAAGGGGQDGGGSSTQDGAAAAVGTADAAASGSAVAVARARARARWRAAELCAAEHNLAMLQLLYAATAAGAAATAAAAADGDEAAGRAAAAARHARWSSPVWLQTLERAATRSEAVLLSLRPAGRLARAPAINAAASSRTASHDTLYRTSQYCRRVLRARAVLQKVAELAPTAWAMKDGLHGREKEEEEEAAAAAAAEEEEEEEEEEEAEAEE
jgi:hypothetical protein